MDEPDGVFGSALEVASSRPFDVAAATLAAACVVMIFVNALALQQGRPGIAPAPQVHHEASRPAPAPAQAPQAPRAEAPVHSDLTAQIQTALAERDLYDGVVDGLKGATTASAIRTFEKSQGMAATGEPSEKILAALLIAPMRKAAPAPAAAPKPAQPAASAGMTTGSTSPDAKLMAAQKALARIGYGPVTIDGKMGLETRNAIKSFEKDRGMPETGEPSPQVMRALQAMTGAPLH